MRIYESRNLQGHVRKVAMFDNGEIDIFRRVGITPVFFGSTVYGPNLPNLVYMICFPSIEARSEAWGKFGQDPDWKRISTAPGSADRELVSRISNQLAHAAAGVAGEIGFNVVAAGNAIADVFFPVPSVSCRRFLSRGEDRRFDLLSAVNRRRVCLNSRVRLTFRKQDPGACPHAR